MTKSHADVVNRDVSIREFVPARQACLREMQVRVDRAGQAAQDNQSYFSEWAMNEPQSPQDTPAPKAA